MLAAVIVATAGAMGATLLFVHFYFGPVLRFAEGLLQKLKHLTTTLEMRVAERTAALRETNSQLRQTLDQNRNMQRQLMDATHIDRLNIGPIPTIQLNWLQPHEGSIVDFLFRARAFQYDKDTIKI